MFEDEKKKCTGAGAKLESSVNSLEKLIIPSAIVIAVVGALACLLTKNLGGILNCLIIAFIYAVALNVAVLVLRYLADISINSEVSARVTASEHEAKVAALTSYNTKAEESADEEPVSNGSPFAPKKSTAKPAAKPAAKAVAQKPVNNSFVNNVKEEDEPDVQPEPEVKEDSASAFKPLAAKPADDTPADNKPFASKPVTDKPAASQPVAKNDKKDDSKPSRPSAAKASDRAASKKDEPSILKSSLSSGGGDKLPGSGSDKDRPVPTTLNKTFVPIGGPAPVATAENAAPSPFKPLAGATPKTKTIDKEETSSAPSPFKPIAKAPAKDPAPAKDEPVAKAAKDDKSEEASPLANKTFTPSPFAPSPAANNLAPAPSPFKPLASKAAAPTKAAAAPEKESAADAAMAKLNKLHKCPKCDVMINTNPCPRCGHEILLEDLLAENKADASASAASADSKSSINKLHKCANCGRIAKQSPCEHCGA